MEIDEHGSYTFNIFSDSPDNLRKELPGAKPNSNNFEKNYFI